MKLLNWSCQKIHCSVDDTLWIFKDLTEHKEYVSIFENPILNKIKVLQDVGLGYIKFTKEFEKNADWLKFGFHGYGFDESETDRT